MDSKQLQTNFQSSLQNLSTLREVESLIEKSLASESSVLQSVSEYLFELGGKRIRPALAIFLGEAFLTTNRERRLHLVQVAAGIELIHMATLLHDDIIDKSSLRRHKTSPFLKYGMTASLLTGDFLLTRAFRLCAHLDEFIINETEKACIELTEGEMDETPLFERRHTVDSYLEIARKKTASLFRLAAVSAGHLALSEVENVEESDRVRSLFASFGENLGIAFQILDDILDVSSTQEELGKPPGIDIHERKPSLVNILWLNSGSELAQGLLMQAAPGTQDGCYSDAERAYAARSLQELKSSSVLAECRQIASLYTRRAAQTLDEIFSALPSSELSINNLSSLKTLIQYAVSRSA